MSPWFRASVFTFFYYANAMHDVISNYHSSTNLRVKNSRFFLISTKPSSTIAEIPADFNSSSIFSYTEIFASFSIPFWRVQKVSVDYSFYICCNVVFSKNKCDSLAALTREVTLPGNNRLISARVWGICWPCYRLSP